MLVGLWVSQRKGNMDAKAYYDVALKKSEDMKLCRLCGESDVTLYIISEGGKPDRVNPVCPHCHSEHVYDQDKNLQKVVTHCGDVSVKANAHADLSAASADKVRRVVGNSGSGD